jgi:hypothetical protein
VVDVIDETSGKIVQRDDFMATIDKLVNDVRADKASSSCY